MYENTAIVSTVGTILNREVEHHEACKYDAVEYFWEISFENVVKQYSLIWN